MRFLNVNKPHDSPNNSLPLKKISNMSVAELKTALIQMAIETDEPNLLEQVIAYFKNLRQTVD